MSKRIVNTQHNFERQLESIQLEKFEKIDYPKDDSLEKHFFFQIVGKMILMNL